ncbi:MAG: hypothetical protein A2784_01340 [Candidatus Chisholmbacteria bacterium RIFCSPHIGHO2_01_FULL_48_12]|uniref:Type 4 fimbrial biogenesis protein PilX N-terminal domain-containing protein n=1 Tax=Candidatus Chisholmbacteria bacterium RIFCSPHIGHO2_01_FULL_48_12 TaxID=1797589 RepID=A0A1G1VLQ2_9BACT|nr:MAG: hypothetical protein A2784_01340 [Candidatus Chisholmbacteria bacterium RIFCSPHIGHO2_01_FULL_48_12]
MEKGQVALIVLLVMVVMLTLGISVAQRGVTDVRISKQEEDSARAFQAAEAGVEEALSTLSSSEGEFGEDVSYNAQVTEAGTTGFVVGQPVAGGETVVVNLAQASPSLSGLNLYFMEQGKDDCLTNPAAIEVSVIEKVGSQTRVRREGFDVQDRDNNFTLVAGGSYAFEGKTWCGKATLNLIGNDEEVRIKVWYNRATIGGGPRPAGATLGNQYVAVESVGKTEGGVTRAVQVQRGEPQLPPMFDYALWSGGGIVKGE